MAKPIFHSMKLNNGKILYTYSDDQIKKIEKDFNELLTNVRNEITSLEKFIDVELSKEVNKADEERKRLENSGTDAQYEAAEDKFEDASDRKEAAEVALEDLLKLERYLKANPFAE